MGKERSSIESYGAAVSALIRYVCVILVGFMVSTCDKQEVLPGPTQTGQNTFGCLLNGKAWIPDGGGGFTGTKPLRGGFYKDTKEVLHVYLRTSNKKGESVHLYFANPTVGTHLLNVNTGFLPNSLDAQNYGYYQAGDGQVYITSAKSTGQVTLTQADTLTGLLSGTFSFTATAKSGATVAITSGRFDLISPQQ